ncbi:hypothetical protein PG997_013440 [Apiospora hydei]|uniref:Ankyrin n=1 Tax=Apiospora hydei TaxID=1337664 RepID=A0ABR1V9Q9_9PEZI
MAERKTGTSPSPRTEGADTKLQGGAFSPPYHDLADPTTCPFEALPVETVLLIAHHCDSVQDQAMLAQASKWLNVIVRPIVYETVCADSEWSVLFWAAERGHTSILQMIDAADKQLCATACKPVCPDAGCIDWNMFRDARETSGDLIDNFLDKIQPDKDVGNTQLHRKWVYEDHDYLTDYNHAFCTPLHLAVLNSHLSTVRFLLDRGVNVDAVSNQIGLQQLAYETLRPSLFAPWRMLLEWVANIAVTPLILAIQFGNYDIAKLLLQHGAAVEMRETRANRPVKFTLLHLLATLAPSKEACQFMEILIQQKYVPVDATDAGGLTPLARAAAMDGGDPVLETLKTLGADVNYVIPAINGAYPRSILETCFETELTFNWGIAERVRAAHRLMELSGEAGDKAHQRSLLLNNCMRQRMRYGYPRPKVLEELIEYLEARLKGPSTNHEKRDGIVSTEGGDDKGIMKTPKRKRGEDEPADERPTVRRS